MARIIFMGTPAFAVPTLQVLAEHHQVVGVVTQPDRRAGRGRKLAVSPVKKAALERNLPLFQPQTLRTPESLEKLGEWQPALIVVAAFGQILPRPVLELAPHGCLNVHASLLPAYRGAAPIAAAILAGEPTSGVTIMQMDVGLDTGPILSQAQCPIVPDETTGSLTAKLADLGARLLVETLPGWLGGAIQARPQDNSLATYCRRLKKEDGALDWTRSAEHLDRQVRATDPWPGAYTTWQGRRLKVLHAHPKVELPAAGQPGQVLALGSGIGVVTGRGVLELRKVQLAGKKPMPADLFARGQQGLIGSLLGGFEGEPSGVTTLDQELQWEGKDRGRRAPPPREA